MATYPEWNEALCAFLFNDDNAGKAVYLHVPEEAFSDDDRLSALGGYQAFKDDMLRELGRAPEDLLTTADRKLAEHGVRPHLLASAPNNGLKGRI